MGQFVQILLLVTVVYLTLILAVKTMFGDYTNLFAIMTAMLLTCMVVLATAMYAFMIVCMHVCMYVCVCV